MSFDLAAIRGQFPILATLINGHPLAYLDNAATAQIPSPVLDAIVHHETRARANVKRSIHTLAEAATEAFETARERMARYLNAYDSDEIIFTSGTTGAINLAAYSYGALLQAGDEVIVSTLEHHSNIVPWQLLRARQGIVLKAIPVTNEGRLDLDKLDGLVTSKTKLIAVTHASNVTGAATEVARIVAAAKSVGAKVLLDGAQRAPHGPVDVRALGVDFYALSSHKMFGPNGAGVLWGRRELLEAMPPFLGGGEMIERVTIEQVTFAPPPHRFEAGTPPIAQVVGMGAAAEWLSGLDHSAIEAHLSSLTSALLRGLSAIKQVRIAGPTGLQERLPIVAFTVDGAHPHDICQMMDGQGVALRGGHHCAQPLMDCFGVTGTTRASLALYNQASEIDQMLAGLDHTLGRLLR